VVPIRERLSSFGEGLNEPFVTDETE